MGFKRLARGLVPVQHSSFRVGTMAAEYLQSAFHRVRAPTYHRCDRAASKKVSPDAYDQFAAPHKTRPPETIYHHF
jgi:hypothetical protein